MSEGKRRLVLDLTTKQNKQALALFESMDAAGVVGATLGQLSRDGSKAYFAVLPRHVAERVRAVLDMHAAEIEACQPAVARTVDDDALIEAITGVPTE